MKNLPLSLSKAALFNLFLVSPLLFNLPQVTARERQSCRSIDTLSSDGCHLLAAEIHFEGRMSMTIDLDSNPLCPQWPRYGMYSGTYMVEASEVRFYGLNGKFIASLQRNSDQSSKFSGMIFGRRFVDCKINNSNN